MKLSLLTICAGLFLTADAIKPKLPIVIWHGTGSSCCNPNSGTGKLLAILKKHYPDLYVRSISVEDTEEEDIRATYFGKMDKQVDKVCKKLSSDPKLKGGFDAIGLSLGGVLMRGLIERCNNTPVHNFITYGTPNAGTINVGISGFSPCRAVDGVLCQTMGSIIKDIPYSDWAQNNAIHTQFYKDVNSMDTYLKKSGFLADINNERSVKNATYKKNLVSLNKYVMIAFANETVVNPPQSTWFGYHAEGYTKKFVSMRQQKIYKEDWIGLKTLDKQKKIVLDELPGRHVELPEKIFLGSLKKHLWSGKPAKRSE